MTTSTRVKPFGRSGRGRTLVLPSEICAVATESHVHRLIDVMGHGDIDQHHLPTPTGQSVEICSRVIDHRDIDIEGLQPRYYGRGLVDSPARIRKTVVVTDVIEQITTAFGRGAGATSTDETVSRAIRRGEIRVAKRPQQGFLEI